MRKRENSKKEKERVGKKMVGAHCTKQFGQKSRERE
jgi:hypothetical protein